MRSMTLRHGALLSRCGWCSLAGLFWLIGCTQPSLAPPPQMLATQVIPGSSVYASSLVLSSDGTPLVAFVGEQPAYMVYFWQDGVPVEPVGQAGNERHTEIDLSLALAPNGEPGIAYVDDRVGDLIYAERDHGRWITVTVDAAGQVGHFSSLAYDRMGNPHISYFDNTHNDIKYAVRLDAGWRVETIDASGQPGFHIPAGFTSFAIGSDPDDSASGADTPQVAYLAYRYKPYDGALRYAVRHSDGWRIETVDASRSAGGFPSLALDAEGRPWISYYRAGTWDYQVGELRVARRTDGRWRIDVIDEQDNAGRFSALAFAPDGRPLIAYYAARTADLRLAWLDRTWRHGTLLVNHDAGSWVTLAFDSQGRAHSTYADGMNRITIHAVVAFPTLSVP